MTTEEFIRLMEWNYYKNGNNKCWDWPRCLDNDGYGKLGMKCEKDGAWKTKSAHRVSYMLMWGKINPRHVVMHICNNPSCFNPNHLAQGTNKANMQHYRVTQMCNF